MISKLNISAILIPGNFTGSRGNKIKLHKIGILAKIDEDRPDIIVHVGSGPMGIWGLLDARCGWLKNMNLLIQSARNSCNDNPYYSV